MDEFFIFFFVMRILLKKYETRDEKQHDTRRTQDKANALGETGGGRESWWRGRKKKGRTDRHDPTDPDDQTDQWEKERERQGEALREGRKHLPEGLSNGEVWNAERGNECVREWRCVCVCACVWCECVCRK
jgi:hypothetical protein